MAVAAKLKTTAREEQKTSIINRARKDQKEVEGIQENTFYKILFDGSLEPEEKAKQVAKELTFTNNRQADRQKVAELDSFKEYLQAVSEKLSKQRIELTNTKVFANLQKMYGDYNDDLENFHKKLQPLVKIIDALYKMRQEGTTDSILEKVREEKELDTEQKKQRKSLAQQLDTLHSTKNSLEEENFQWTQQRTWFGLGGLTPEAKARIQANDLKIEEVKQQIAAIEQQIADLDIQITNRANAVDQSFEYQQLKELLNLNSDGHTNQQKELIQAAVDFIDSSKEKFTEVCELLGDMTKQIGGLCDNNSKMIQTYAVISDATKMSEDINIEKRTELDKILQDFEGSSLEKMKLEEQRNDLNDFVDNIITSAADTTQSYGELAREQIVLNNMKNSTKNQNDKAKVMNSRGVAKMASSLCTTLTAINAAGVNESQARGMQMLDKISDITSGITKKDVIRVATGRNEINKEIEKLFIDLEDLGNAQQDATRISREAVESMRSNLNALKQMSEGVLDDVAEAVSVAGDTLANENKAPVKAQTKSANPFE